METITVHSHVSGHVHNFLCEILNTLLVRHKKGKVGFMQQVRWNLRVLTKKYEEKVKDQIVSLFGEYKEAKQRKKLNQNKS